MEVHKRGYIECVIPISYQLNLNDILLWIIEIIAHVMFLRTDENEEGLVSQIFFLMTRTGGNMF